MQTCTFTFKAAFQASNKVFKLEMILSGKISCSRHSKQCKSLHSSELKPLCTNSHYLVSVGCDSQRALPAECHMQVHVR